VAQVLDLAARRLPDASEWARAHLAKLDPAESLGRFASYFDAVAALFTQSSAEPPIDR